ncbi:serine/arginine repetitive matrix protein 1-like isoform X2 [Platichthys flesus]|uniref:serine/arginine repetitive matrix protein 1-like isoform X2 n=1 Tax=Platichthys flesus TaxID=8260 RepID=UPI002DBD5B79|nr:serine/arginine repetitive matrix protein 1-like isoform X2 [Platichthys flesus]XP_062253302.1 serine/arginine repetitive matrix protein 1-like isoform X2 [Platichthys flesus]XP_062253303.1 serine/arginine repetitive matrix protein 1-like isoform X2 [Platichthys flesus]
MPSRKHKPCRSKKAAKSNFPQIRSLDPNQAGRDVVEDIMEGGRERWCFSPPRTYPSSIFSKDSSPAGGHRSSRPTQQQIRNLDPDQRGRDIPEEIMAEGQGSKDSTPPGGHRSSRPTQQQIRNLDPDQRGRDIPEEIMAEGQGSKDSTPPGGHRSSRPTQQQIRNLDPEQRGRDIPEEIMAEGQGSKDSSPAGGHRSSRPTQQQIRNLDPDQRGRDIPEEIMAEGQGSKDSSPAGGHRSSRPTQQQIRNLDPEQRGRDIQEEIMAEGQGSKDSSPAGGHRSSRPTQQQIRNLDPDQRGRDIPEEIMAKGQGSKDSSPAGGHRSSRPTQQQIRNLDPEQRGRDIQEEIMAEGQGSKDSSPAGGHRSSRPTQQQIRNLDPDQRGRDIPEEIMAEGQGSKDSTPPGGHRSSRPTQQQIRNLDPEQRGRDIPEEIMAEGQGSKDSSPAGGHRSSRPTQQQIRNLDPEQRGRDIPEEIMAEGQGSKDSSPPGGHRSSRPTQQQYRERQPYVRRPQQYQDKRTYEPRPGPEGRHPHYPEQYPSSRGAERRYRNRQPYVRRPQQYQDKRTYEPHPGPEGRHPHYPEQYPSSRGAERRVHDRYPDQRGRDDLEEVMAEGRVSRYSSPPGGHRSSNLSPKQYYHRQPYVRPTQQYYENQTYEPRPGPEGRHPHYPERPVYSGANRMIRDRYPDQRGRDDTEEIMAEGQGSRYSSPPGGHRSSRPTQQQYRDRQPYVRRPQQYQDQRSYEPRPGQEGRHPHYPEQYPSSRGAERRVHERYPDQRGRDDPEEVMAEGRERRYSSPPGGHRSSNLSPQQYHHRQPYVRPTQQYYENQTYEPRPGPEGRHPHYPERPVYSGANRMVRDRYPDQRGRDDTEEIMAEGRGSRHASPSGGHRSSPPTQPQYRHRQPNVRPTQQNDENRNYEPRPGPEGRHPHYPERPVYSGANRMVHDRYPDQRGRDDPEEIMAEGQGSRHASPPGGHRSSPPTQPQYHHRQPYVRPTQQYYENQTYEPRPGPEGRHPHYPERPLYSVANRMIHDRYPDQRGRDDPEEVMAEGRESRDSTPPGRHRSSPPTQPQHSKRPGKPTPKAVDPTTQPILMNKKEASDTKPGPVDGPKLHQVGLRSSSPGLVTPSLAPPNPPTKDEPLLDEPSTALSVAAPEALNSLAETTTELETAGHDMRPQDPTPPQCPNSEAPLTLKSRSSSGKRGRKGRKRHNKPPYTGSPR